MNNRTMTLAMASFFALVCAVTAYGSPRHSGKAGKVSQFVGSFQVIGLGSSDTQRKWTFEMEPRYAPPPHFVREADGAKPVESKRG